MTDGTTQPIPSEDLWAQVVSLSPGGSAHRGGWRSWCGRYRRLE